MLVKALNDKRIEDPSAAKHREIHTLEVMLGLLNKGQGLGFVVAGTVLDKRFGIGSVVKLSGLGVSAIGYVVALGPPKTFSGCELSEAQQLAVQAMLVSLVVGKDHVAQSSVSIFSQCVCGQATFNATCTYTMTVGPDGLKDGCIG